MTLLCPCIHTYGRRAYVKELSKAILCCDRAWPHPIYTFWEPHPSNNPKMWEVPFLFYATLKHMSFCSRDLHRAYTDKEAKKFCEIRSMWQWESWPPKREKLWEVVRKFATHIFYKNTKFPAELQFLNFSIFLRLRLFLNIEGVRASSYGQP